MVDRIPTDQLLWDGYNECYWTPEQVKEMLLDYHKWCKRKKQDPEVMTIEFIDENTIGHVAYHAQLQRDWVLREEWERLFD
jgi:hypothetical protein